jgi:hypothetical protein
MTVPLEEKVHFVRKLVEERLKGSLFGGFFSQNVANMTVEEAMGSPEGTIVTIVEIYHDLCASGALPVQALSALENDRSKMVPGQVPRAHMLGLEGYVKYRVRLEHSRGRQMSDSEITRACSATLKWLSQMTDEEGFKPKRPADFELASEIASLIDGFIENDGVAEFESNRLLIVVGQDYRVWIGDLSQIKDARISIPLCDLMLSAKAISEGGMMRHVAVDACAQLVLIRLDKLEPRQN